MKDNNKYVYHLKSPGVIVFCSIIAVFFGLLGLALLLSSENFEEVKTFLLPSLFFLSITFCCIYVLSYRFVIDPKKNRVKFYNTAGKSFLMYKVDIGTLMALKVAEHKSFPNKRACLLLVYDYCRIVRIRCNAFSYGYQLQKLNELKDALEPLITKKIDIDSINLKGFLKR